MLQNSYRHGKVSRESNKLTKEIYIRSDLIQGLQETAYRKEILTQVEVEFTTPFS